MEGLCATTILTAQCKATSGLRQLYAATVLEDQILKYVPPDFLLDVICKGPVENFTAKEARTTHVSPVCFRLRTTAFLQCCFTNTRALGSSMTVSSTIACSCTFQQLAEAVRRCSGATTMTLSQGILVSNACSSLCQGNITGWACRLRSRPILWPVPPVSMYIPCDIGRMEAWSCCLSRAAHEPTF
jgi:hypothetical protein